MRMELENKFNSFKPNTDNWVSFSNDVSSLINSTIFPSTIDTRWVYQAIAISKQKTGLDFINSLTGVMAIHGFNTSAKELVLKLSPYYPELLSSKNETVRLVS